MISILFLVAAIIILFFCARKRPAQRKAWGLAAFVGLNVLLVEIVLYVYFVFLVGQGRVLLLVGQQPLLDFIIKRQINTTLQDPNNQNNQFYRLDPELGYSLAPNGRLVIYSGERDRDEVRKDSRNAIFYTTNSAAIRSEREYTAIPGPSTLRMAVFGDSFVFGDGERNRNIWTYFLESSIKNLEVVNFGVSGYGLGQSYLRYLTQGIAYHPDIIFFNYVALGPRDRMDIKTLMSEGNLKESTLYRVYYWVDDDGHLQNRAFTPHDLFSRELRSRFIYAPYGLKPFEQSLLWRVLTKSNLGLFIRKVAIHNALKNFDEKNMESTIAVNVKLLDNLSNIARSQKSSVLFFCGIPFSNLPAAIQQVIVSNKDNVVYVDSGPMLERRMAAKGFEKKNLLNASNHYNPMGNLIYAEVMASILKSRPWGAQPRQFQFDSQTHVFNRLR